MKRIVNMRHTIIRPPARTAPAGTGMAPGQRLGSLIGGIFGLIYVEVNAGLLPEPWAAVLQIAAVVAFAGLAVLLARDRGRRSAARPAARGGFGGWYWLVVAGEAAAILAGAAILNGPAGLPRAVVAWVSVVVGVHFLVLAAIWRLPLFRHLGAAIALCGAAGLTAAAVGATPAVIAATGGVLPGILLLSASYWGAATLRRATPARAEGHAAPAHTGSSRE
jgi:hypothetical protein